MMPPAVAAARTGASMATKILFSATDSTYGYELWVTDGTAGGTVLVKDIFPGTPGSYPKNITALGNGKAVFSATDGFDGRELWVTDGTTAGTYRVKDIGTGSSNSNPQYI